MIAARDWKRVKWTRASQLAPLLDGMVDLDGLNDLPPAEAFNRLRADNQIGATRFIAQCLPRMDAVQWTAACLQRTGMPADPVRAAAYTAVQRWIADPSDKLRRIAFDAGARAGWGTAEGAACLAIYLSGGSLAPAEQEQAVQPQPGTFGQAVAGSVLITALRDDPTRFEPRLGELLELANAAAAGEPLNFAA